MAYQETPAARLRALRQRWEADRTSRVFLQLAEEYRRQGMPREALPVLEEGLKHHGSSIAGQVALGRCRLELGQAEGAAAILEKVVERDPTQMVAYRTLVDTYTKLGAPSEARDRLSHYAQLNPQDPEIEALDGQIAVLERAAAAGFSTAAHPESEVEVEVEITPPAEENPPAAGISAPGPRESVAALWPAQPSEPSVSQGWSTGGVDVGWVTQAPPPAVPASLASAPPPPALAWPPSRSDDDAATAMFSRVEETPLREDAFAKLQPPSVAETEPSRHEVDDAPELATVQLSLDEIRGSSSSSAPASAPAWREEEEGASSAEDEPLTVLPRADEQTLPWEDSYEPELVATGSDEAVSEPLAEAVGYATPPVANEPEPARSWSIGESEIVFSLPTTLLLRDLVDLATVPRRPLALPAWSHRAAPVASAAGALGAAAISTPTLAELYLKQGHASEAAELFEQVLEREPENVVARMGLDRLQRLKPRVTARSLLADLEPGAGLSEKQAHVLRRWAALVREAHGRDAS